MRLRILGSPPHPPSIHSPQKIGGCKKSKIPVAPTLRIPIMGCSFLLIPLDKKIRKIRQRMRQMELIFTQAELKQVSLSSPSCTDEKRDI